MAINKGPSAVTLAPDDVAYFQHADGVLPSYATLRAMSGQAGDTYYLTSANPLVNGDFAWQATDPYGNGDDGGTVIADQTGYWVRQYTYSNVSPIELDWFEITQDSEITTLFGNLATGRSPNLWLRTPTVQRNMYLDYTNLTGTTTDFRLFSGGALSELRQLASPSGAAESNLVMLRCDEYVNFVIKPGVIFRGQYALKELAATGGMVSANNTTAGTLFDCQADFTDTPCFGINHTGAVSGASRTASGTIGGTFDNSGIRCNSGIVNLHMADAVVKDPEGGGLAAAFEKWHGCWMQSADNLTGELTLQYGAAGWFMTNISNIGASAIDPLIINSLNIGYDEALQVLPKLNLNRWQAGKIDQIRDVAAGNRFMRLVGDGNCLAQYAGVFEATPDAAPTGNNDVKYVRLELDNATSERGILIGDIPTSANAWQGAVSDNTIVGTADNLLITAAGNDCSDIVLTGQLYYGRKESSGDYPRPDNCEGTNVTADNLLVRAGQNLAFTNLTLTKTTGAVIDFSTNDSEPISVSVTTLNAAAGTTVTNSGGATVTFTLDGDVKTLPYAVPA